jgi:hypothetical protein
MRSSVPSPIKSRWTSNASLIDRDRGTGQPHGPATRVVQRVRELGWSI